MSCSKQYRLLRKAAAGGPQRFDPFFVLGVSATIMSPEQVAEAVESRCVLLVSHGGIDDEENVMLKTVIDRAGEILSNPITMQSCLAATKVPQQAPRKGKRCNFDDDEQIILNQFESILRTSAVRSSTPDDSPESSLEKRNRKSRQAERKRQLKEQQALQLERRADQLLYSETGRNQTSKKSPKMVNLKNSFKKASWGTQKDLPPGTIYGPHGLGGTTVLRYVVVIGSSMGSLFNQQPITTLSIRGPLEKSGGRQKLTTTDLTSVGVIEDLGLGSFEGGQSQVLKTSGLRRRSSRGLKSSESGTPNHSIKCSLPVAINKNLESTGTGTGQSYSAFSIGSVSTSKSVSPLGYQFKQPVGNLQHFPVSPLSETPISTPGNPSGFELNRSTPWTPLEPDSDIADQSNSSTSKSDSQSCFDDDIIEATNSEELIFFPPSALPTKRLSAKITLKDTSISQCLLWTLLPLSMASLKLQKPFNLTLKGACDTGELPFSGVQYGIGGLMRLFGLDVDFEIIKRRGHQRDEVRVKSGEVTDSNLIPVSLTTPGTIKNIRITVWISKAVSVDHGQKAARAASQALYASLQHTFSGTSLENLIAITETDLNKEDSVEGNSLSVFVSISSALGGTWCGWSIGKGTKVELTGERAASRVVSDILKGGCVSEYLQDHAAILQALSTSHSLSTTRVRISPASKNLNTAIPLLQNLLPVKFSFVSAGRSDFGSTCKPGIVMQCEPSCNDSDLYLE